MLVEEFVSAISGPPLSSNTAIAKHNGLYVHTLNPTYGVRTTLKNSSVAANCVAVNDSHVFAAQQDKAYVHVYSKARGTQDAFVPFPERIRCVTLAGDVLVLGTVEGRLMLWELGTGRLVSTPPRHVQPVSCVAAGPFHILTGSDDSDVHVWSLAQLLELGSPAEHDPERSLSNHRAAITALALSPGSNPETSLCVSGSKDKSCILWNYHSGEPLRTLLFPSPPLCMALDPAVRALVVSTADASLYLAEFFARRPLLGATAEDASTVVQITNPFGAAPPDAGPASCVDVSYDGTTLLTGHPRGQILKWDIAENKTPVVVTNLNAAVTNLVFCPPFKMDSASQTPAIVKPSALAGRSYTLTTMLGTAPASSQQDTRFDTLLNTPGFSRDVLENAVVTAHEPGALTAGEHELQHQNEQLWEIVHEQRAIHKQMYRHLLGSRSS